MLLRLMKDGIWPTIQGEGVYLGTPSIFMRTAGCDLRCHVDGGRFWTCDTPESLPDYDHKLKVFQEKPTRFAEDVETLVVAERLVEAFRRTEFTHLVITGGEPTLQSAALVKTLTYLGVLLSRPPTVTLETNCRYFDQELALCVDLPSLSPKLQTYSWKDGRERDILIKWVHHCAEYGKSVQVKIVCASAGDVESANEIFQIVRHRMPTPSRYFVIQPAHGNSQPSVLLDAIFKLPDPTDILFLPQAHKYLEAR